MEKMQFLGPPGSVCKQRFFDVVVDVLGAKSLVEHDSEG